MAESKTKVYIGVDGGATKTHVVAINEQGTMLAEAFTGSSNPNSVGADTASKNLLDGIDEVIKACSADAVARIVCGLAGVDRPKDAATAKAWIAAKHPSTAIIIHNDAVAALSSGNTEGKLTGIVCISGTGMIVYGHRDDGASDRCGGWGALTDPGSGYWISVECMRRFWDAFDGSGPSTSITKHLLEFCKLERPEELIDWCYGTAMSWGRIASLAPVVFKAAREGDKVAIELLHQAADALCSKIVCVAGKLCLVDGDAGSLPVVVAGSITAQPEIKHRMEETLSKSLPVARVTAPVVSAAMGAAYIALHSK